MIYDIKLKPLQVSMSTVNAPNCHCSNCMSNPSLLKVFSRFSKWTRKSMKLGIFYMTMRPVNIQGLTQKGLVPAEQYLAHAHDRSRWR
jgi:hypothetical protein